MGGENYFPLEVGKWKLLQRVHESIKKMNRDYARVIASGETIVAHITREDCNTIYEYDKTYHRVEDVRKVSKSCDLFLLVRMSVNGHYFKSYINMRVINVVGNYLLSGSEVKIHFSKSLDYDYDLMVGVANLCVVKREISESGSLVILFTEISPSRYFYNACDLKEEIITDELKGSIRGGL